MKLYLLTLCYLAFLPISLFAQSTSIVTAQKPDFLSRLYYDSTETAPIIYKGKEHKYYSFRIEGHPFFFSDDIAPCEITYNDFVYNPIQGFYDMHKQVLIVEHDKLSYAISLEQKKISSFKMYGHLFENLYVDSIPGMQNGYYDLMVDGNTKFYVRREKELRKEIENQRIREWFTPLDKYYILKEGIFHRVRGKGSVLKVLLEHKKELKNYIRKQRISFSEFPENGIEKIVKHYNEL